MSTLVREIAGCRSCGFKRLKAVLSLGEIYISGFVDSGVEPIPQVPLDLVLCDKVAGGCGLVQLRHTTPAEWLYRQYWYHSGMNETMRAVLAEIASVAERVVSLKPNDLVLDIGCNDGTLLRSYSNASLLTVGFEPAANMAPLARRGTTRIINDFFNWPAFQKEFPNKTAKVITSIAMFYDLDNPNDFVQDVARCLSPDGLWIIQMNYLPTMLEQNSFDNICHEHLEYYSLIPLRALLERHGLEIFDVELNRVNGGSFRIYVQHQGAPLKSGEGPKKRSGVMEENELSLKLDQPGIYQQFSRNILALRKKLLTFVQAEKEGGKTIYAYGASTKGNTLLQFCGLGHRLIPKIVDKNRDKWGKKTVGTAIPIISEEQARSESPDYFLILPWHFLEEFMVREREFLRKGGKFIVPIPEFRIVGPST